MRIFFTIVLALVALYLPFWFFLLCAVVYASRVSSPYELLVVGYCIDAVYAPGWYMYTIGTGLTLIFATLIRTYVVTK